MATPIECPHCRNSIVIKDIRPGQFRIKCPRCDASFVLIVPSEPGTAPSVAISPAEPGPSGSSRPDPGPEVVAEELPPGVTPSLLASEFATPPVENDDSDTIEDPRRKEESLDAPVQPPRMLGGYRVGRRIGLIRVGTSFEGRRMATGRDVALAVIKPRWSALPVFVSRIAREAYAASQIEHPNLLPPLDFDISRGFPFVASGALQGTPLSDPEGRQGLDRKARVAAILQVARGLRHAHEQGIYHRDITLNKIRVEPGGLAFLADLGVGLAPETPEAASIAAIPVDGMAPPPNTEPSRVGFVRQDLSSLGRALQGLIGGNLGDRALSPSLASITRKMLGEVPESRFQDMGAVVRALEGELGVADVFTPLDEDAHALEAEATAFHESPLAGLRSKIALGALATLGLFVILAFLTRPLLALPAIGLALFAGTTLIVFRGITSPHPLYDRFRELILGGGRANVLTTVATLGLLVIVLWFTGSLGTWLFLGIFGVALGSAYHFAIDRPLADARREPVLRARALIKRFRLMGISEDAIRGFVSRHSGVGWRSFSRLFSATTL